MDFSKLKSSKTSLELNQLHNLTSITLVKTNNGETQLIKHEDLKEIKLLGSGEFGVVKHMLHIPTNLEFAVKVFSLVILLWYVIKR